MTIDFMESHYAHLNDSDDVRKLLGPYVQTGIANVGDVRRASQGRPKSASIRLENDGSGFYIVDCPGKFSCG